MQLTDVIRKCHNQLAIDLNRRVDRLINRRFAPFRVFRLRRILRIIRKVLG